MSSVDFNKTGSIIESGVVDNDVHVKLQELTSKLTFVEKEKQDLEQEKLEMQSSYDGQRAKYQKLYMQKEDEVKRLQNESDELKTQLYIAQMNENRLKEETIKVQEAQIAELSQIVADTVEHSSSSSTQVRNLQKTIKALEDQLNKLTSEKHDSLLLAPSNMLSATKSFAMKMVSQLGPDQDRSADIDLEDSMEKASREAEVIRSLVVPLENTIKDLEEKLKSAEDRLRIYEHGKKQSSPETSSEDAINSSSLDCVMCANYEDQLQVQQQHAIILTKQKETLEVNMEKFKEDLAKETQFRKQMEEKWNERKEEQKLQIDQLKAEVVAGKNELEDLTAAFEALRSISQSQLKQLTFDRENIYLEMQALLKQNDNLMGKHSKHSEELRNEAINFPDTVEELQEVLLRLHEDLIAALVAKEHKEEIEQTLTSEVQLLQNQLAAEQGQRIAVESSLEKENSVLRYELDRMAREMNKLKTDYDDLVKKEFRYKSELSIANDLSLIKSEDNKKNLEIISELKSRVSLLQSQLDRGEDVQKDFVKLSQSLQVQLEKIRSADSEVRWQYEEDVTDCQNMSCKCTFTSPKKKLHCRHCGKLFCQECLKHEVLSGPNQRPSRVCDVCHTLLMRYSAPYFSQQPPASPD